MSAASTASIRSGSPTGRRKRFAEFPPGLSALPALSTAARSFTSGGSFSTTARSFTSGGSPSAAPPSHPAMRRPSRRSSSRPAVAHRSVSKLARYDSPTVFSSSAAYASTRSVRAGGNRSSPSFVSNQSSSAAGPPSVTFHEGVGSRGTPSRARPIFKRQVEGKKHSFRMVGCSSKNVHRETRSNHT